MHLVLAFAIVLFVGVLSGLAHRILLSTAVLFLLAGFLLGDGVTGVLTLRPDDDIVIGLAELALVSVLYTDGMRVGFSDLRSAWRLPGRALVLGIFVSILAHSSTDVPIAHAFARAEAQRSRSGGGATQELTPQSDGASGDSQP